MNTTCAVTFKPAKRKTAARVTRVMLPERFAVGDTNIRQVQAIDSAAWIWYKKEAR